MKKSTTQTMKKNKLTNTDEEKLGVVIFIGLNSKKRNTARNRGVFYDQDVKSSKRQSNSNVLAPMNIHQNHRGRENKEKLTNL